MRGRVRPPVKPKSQDRILLTLLAKVWIFRARVIAAVIPWNSPLITLANKAHAATLVEESLADRTSPVWELVDAERVRAAIAGFDDLPMGPRQRLYGLAGAARWLAG